MRGCPFYHEDIEVLHGVPPCPVEVLPKVCTCGAPLTYADNVMFVSAPVSTLTGDVVEITPVEVTPLRLDPRDES